MASSPPPQPKMDFYAVLGVSAFTMEVHVFDPGGAAVCVYKRNSHYLL
jgi:hypothetical protein